MIAPSRTDPVVRGASELVGGPLGAHAAEPRRRFWVPVRVVLALMVVALGLAYVQKAPCLEHPWSNDYQYSRMCYSDVYALYFAEGLNQGQVPYADHPVEYPVVIGGLMEVAAWTASHAPAPDRPRAFFDVTVLLLASGGLLVAWTTVRLAGRRRPYDAAMVALAPVVALHAYTNWDLAAAALTGAGLWAWARRRPGWAGVLLGLGVATKLYPLLVIGALLLLCLRARRMRAWWLTFGTAAAAWLAVDLPVALAWPGSFGRFYALNRSRPADWDSLWYAAGHLLGHQPGTAFVNVGSALLLAVALSAVAGLVLRAPRRPRLGQVGFLVLVAFLLTSKVYSPQYALWLLPFAVLARPRWPAFLAWQATEVVLLATRFGFFIGHDHPGQGLPAGIFLAAVAARDLALLALTGLVVREVLHPEHDVVRADDVDDPAGGLLADVPRAQPVPA